MEQSWEMRGPLRLVKALNNRTQGVPESGLNGSGVPDSGQNGSGIHDSVLDVWPLPCVSSALHVNHVQFSRFSCRLVFRFRLLLLH